MFQGGRAAIAVTACVGMILMLFALDASAASSGIQPNMGCWAQASVKAPCKEATTRILPTYQRLELSVARGQHGKQVYIYVGLVYAAFFCLGSDAGEPNAININKALPITNGSASFSGKVPNLEYERGNYKPMVGVKLNVVFTSKTTATATLSLHWKSCVTYHIAEHYRWGNYSGLA